MDKKQSEIEDQLKNLGYGIISGFVTMNQYPLGRVENGLVYPELISPTQLINEFNLKEELGTLEIKLKEAGVPYRQDGKVIIGDEEISLEDYKENR